MIEKLTLTEEWDKTFAKSNKVKHKKVTFHNRYGITLAADLYIPNIEGNRFPSLAVCGPFGASKEVMHARVALLTLYQMMYLSLSKIIMNIIRKEPTINDRSIPMMVGMLHPLFRL